MDEAIEALNIKSNGIYVDGTLGGCGHAKKILSKLSCKGLLIGIDQDACAIENAKKTIGSASNVVLIHNNFVNIDNILKEQDINAIDGFIIDIGLSSHQIDTASRGFSYINHGPLDMRMDRTKGHSAYDVVNGYDEKELCYILKNYGEERFAKNIVKNIIKERQNKPITTTTQLSEIIKKSMPRPKDGSNPAKRTFQAIRIEVNNEINILGKTILSVVQNLNTNGRIAVITFHSLEDRAIKNIFNELKNCCSCPREFPMCICNKKPIIKHITKKVIIPTDNELAINPRAKSAKLRVVEKL